MSSVLLLYWSSQKQIGKSGAQAGLEECGYNKTSLLRTEATTGPFTEACREVRPKKVPMQPCPHPSMGQLFLPLAGQGADCSPLRFGLYCVTLRH